jgi:hypothetical protein
LGLIAVSTYYLLVMEMTSRGAIKKFMHDCMCLGHLPPICWNVAWKALAVDGVTCLGRGEAGMPMVRCTMRSCGPPATKQLDLSVLQDGMRLDEADDGRMKEEEEEEAWMGVA